jgi:hypothetical protein
MMGRQCPLLAAHAELDLALGEGGAQEQFELSHHGGLDVLHDRGGGPAQRAKNALTVSAQS